MTPSIRRILCPVDLEQAAPSVLECAASLATTFGATLEALHVRSSGARAPSRPFQSRAELVESLMAAHAVDQRLSHIIDGASAKVRVSKKVLGGMTAETILEEIERSETDLLVVGSSARSAWWQKRSTGADVSNRAPCAVLTVPAEAPALFARRVLLPVDFSVATEVALEWTILLARTFASHVDVLHALPAEAPGRHAGASSLRRPRLTRALTRLAAIVARLREAGVSDTTSVLVEGDTLDAILARNQSESASLIVMGRHPVAPPARASCATQGTIAWVRASLAVSVLSVRSPPVGSTWNWQDLPCRAGTNRATEATERSAARAC